MNICVYFSLYPMMADKVYAEIKSVLGTRDPTFDDLLKLTYTRAVIQETLRLWPPGTYLIRSPQEDDIVGDHRLKKGDIVIIPTYAIQRRSKYWMNPEGFDPERFLHPLTSDQQWLYMPFALGQQACIGGQFATMEATLVLAMLAQRFRLALIPGSSLKRDPGMVNRLNIHIMMRVSNIHSH
jgi:cytochrome P450